MTNKEKWLNYFNYYSFNGRLYINCKYRPQLKDNSSLRRLIQKGLFKINREGFHGTSKRTYLTLS